MKIKGLTFVGTRTAARDETVRFARQVLGLSPRSLGGATPGPPGPEVFDLPDGSSFAVTDPAGPDDHERTVGFLVDDVAEAVAELRAAGVAVDDEVSTLGQQRYIHFRAPDGHLYELVEQMSDPS